MKLETNDYFEIIKFPDGHKHLCLKRSPEFYAEHCHSISISIKSFDDLFLLAQLRKLVPTIRTLNIEYLLGARCDRKFSSREALDLKIIADFINQLKFDSVSILKPHSDVSLALIENSTGRTVTSDLFIRCVSEQGIRDYSIISPDAGASKWIEKELGRHDIIQCSKDRDVISGEIRGVKIPEQPRKSCIIVDDICDGGATFIFIAKQLKAMGVQNIYLVVTHGIFSKGFDVFSGLLNKIYCTDSFNTFDHPIVNVMSLYDLD